MASLFKSLSDSFNPPIAAMPATTPSIPLHPYYPIEAEIVGYLANEWNTLELCSMFAAGCSVIFAFTYTIVKRLRPNISTSDMVTVLWFILCTYPNACDQKGGDS
jgi:cholestenol delta-isomerase